ncbi:hypothetical protein KJ785_02270 [Patescibacteria group bacterium]|nr:hypothetical protein [Patescibacteria group bacterium]
MPEHTRNSETNKNLYTNRSVAVKEQIIGRLNDWAHAGTKEGVENLKKFIANERDRDLREHAKIALEEAKFFYYGPDTDTDEKDFMLARLIHQYDKHIWELLSEADDLKEEIKEFKLKKAVHKRVMNRNLSEETYKEWEYNVMDDFIFYERNRLYEIEQDVRYKSAWIIEAKKMVSSKKYLNMPADEFDHIHFANEDCSWLPEEYFNDDSVRAGSNSEYGDYEQIEVEDIPF